MLDFLTDDPCCIVVAAVVFVCVGGENIQVSVSHRLYTALILACYLYNDLEGVYFQNEANCRYEIVPTYFSIISTRRSHR